MMYLKNREEVKGERVNESMPIYYLRERDDTAYRFIDRMKRGRRIERDLAKHVRARDYRDSICTNPST